MRFLYLTIIIKKQTYVLQSINSLKKCLKETQKQEQKEKRLIEIQIFEWSRLVGSISYLFALFLFYYGINKELG
ncbi:hypothetical protein HPP_4470 [Hydrangea phyllody phytoplasma]|uniref:Uncharacterized protein n=2 Tax=16SrI (Aster yellows group) TaxID=3042590 RepID=A0ABQ5PS05_9MOLU|nr:hypothetical protein HPP_4470 [Hydrangea phyllody phytoplasma]GLH61216.1 hypothetical protein RHYP_1610 [Rhus yellows phytoplasma]GLH61995.1 hypothetical protein HP2P_4020 [Hydrangea phyllody phytoplasma]